MDGSCSFNFYLGGELERMQLDDRDVHTFQLNLWEIYMEKEGDPFYRLQ